MGILRMNHSGYLRFAICFMAMTLFVAAMSTPARSETVPSIPASASMPTTGGWYSLYGKVYPPFPGFSSGQAVCDLYGRTYQPSSIYGGMCGSDYAIFVLYMQACPAGYYFHYSTAYPTQETCYNSSAPNQCPGVAAGETPFTLDLGGLTCSRPDTEKLIITLAPEIATIEPWHKKHDKEHLKANLPYKAIVKDQNDKPKANFAVTITTEVTSDSGGHVHTNGRPKGKLVEQVGASVSTKAGKETIKGNTNGSGVFEFTFGAEEASGTHTLTAKCDSGCQAPADATVKVMVKEAEAADWKPIPVSSLYALQDSSGAVIGAIPGVHTGNHYLTGEAIGQLEVLAKIYQAINPGNRIYLNDASLEWGGLFDVGSTRWKSPHAGHRRGKVIDIRAANSNPPREGAIPLLMWEDFSKKAAKKNIKAELHCFEQANLVIGSQCYFVPEGRHFHVQLFSGVDQ